MIRPLTFLCASAFVFSGFHLYQTKHLAQVTDRQIVQTMRDVNKAHNHAVLLRAEYALLNDPTRLQDLAQQYLTLRPTAPGQFVAMADLASRLPPIGPSPNAIPDAVTPGDGLPMADIPMASATPPDPAPNPAADPAPDSVVAAATPLPPPVPPQPAPARPAAAPTVVAAAAPLEGVVHSVSLIRPEPPRTEPRRAAPAPTPLHQVARQARAQPYIAPVRPAVRYEPQRAPAYVQRSYAEQPSYSGTPFTAPRYGATPVAARGQADAPARPMAASALGMARTMNPYPAGGNR